MNRLFLLVAFLVLGKISYSQYPLTQNLGSDSTIVVSKGALQSRLIPIVVSDTNAANAQRMKSYPGAQLFTTNGNFYYRNSTATKWILVSSGSAGPVNIYNTDGTLTGNRILTGAGNSLYFDGISGLGINTLYDSLLTVDGGIHATGGLRVEKLTTSPGTKALRIDGQGVVSVADTSGGTVTSIATNNGTGITGGTITTSGTLAIDTTNVISTKANVASGLAGKLNISDTASMLNPYLRKVDTASLSNRINQKLNISDTAAMLSPYLRSNTAAATYVPQTRTLTINGTTQDLSANRTYNVGTVTSVGLTMPAAFNVANSPVTSSGTLAVTGAGLASQYIRGDGTLANFPGGGGGGGASISYYLNGSVNQGTFGGNTYYEMNKVPIFGAGTNFSINANGYIAQFITDAGDPGLLNIPAGNWNFELFFNASSGGGSPTYYVELYKYDGTTFTLIASGSTNPDAITGGTSVDAYFSTLPVPQTTLTLTDRLAIRIYVTHSGRTITLHTEDNNLCQIITTFTTGITALNSLTAQVQYLTTGTSGTDFNISSLTDTHTFNLPVASATNTGKLSSSNWSTFNSKIGPSDTASMLAPYLRKADTTAMLANYVNNVGYGLSKAGQVVSADSSTLANYFLRRKDSLTSTNLLGYVTRTILADTAAAIRSSDAGGTVTSVATNNGTGITGGTITSTGTLAIDTLLISTRAWRQKGVDSVAALINSNVSGTTNRVSKFTGANTIGNSSIADSSSSVAMTILSNGNIGINTTAPNERLEIVGTSRFTRTTSPSVYLNISMENGFAEYDARGSIDHVWENGGVENMRLALGGNLGIGTASPDSMLTVLQGARFQRGVRMSGLPSAPGTRALRIDANGTLSVADTTTGGGGGIGGSGTTNYLPKFTASTTLGDSRFFDNGTVTFLGNGDVNATPSTGIFSGTGGTGTNIAGAELRIQGGQGTGTGAGGPITFYTSAAGTSGSTLNTATERMRIDTRGNLGINTTPQSWGTSYRAIQIGQRGGLWAHTAAGSTYLSENIWDDGSASKYIVTGAAAGYQMASGAHYWYQAASGTAGANITLNTSMFLNTSNNLGIGTTTIGSRLQVNGNAAIGYSASTAAPTNGLVVAGNAGFGTNNSGNFNGISFTGPFVDVAGILQVKGTSANIIAAIQLGGDTFRKVVLYSTIGTEDPAFGIGIASSGSTSAGSDRFRINSSGVVFVGNGETAASPNTGIISGTGGTGTNIAGAEFRIRGGASTGSAAGGPITFYTSAAGSSGTGVNAATERMRIDTRGNLGLGVTPSAWASAFRAIQIGARSAVYNSDINFTGLGNNIFYDGSFYRYITTAASSTIELGSGVITFGNAPSGTAGAIVSGSERMRIDASGNLGIGTTTIGSRLQVNGNAAIGYSASTAAPTNGLAVSGNVGVGTLTPGTVAGYQTVQIQGSTTGALLEMWGNAARILQINANINDVNIYGATNIPMIFYTNTVERLRITNTGSVFIGNGETAATPTLGIVSGTGGTGTNIAGAEFRIRGGASTGNAAGGIISFYTSAAGSSGTGVNAATERMRIDQTNLSLSLNTIRIKNGAANTSFVRAEENASTAAFTYLTMDGRSTGFFSFSTNDLERMRITSGGSVGIGTTTIGSTLQVNGNAAIGYSASTAAPTNGLAVAGGITSGAYIAALGARISSAPSAQGVYLGNSGTTSTDYATIEIVGGSAGGGEIDFTSPSVDIKGRIGYNNSSDFMQFLTNGTEKLRISSGGQVTLSTGANVSAIAQTGYSLTGSNAQSLIDLAGTWNTTGNPTAIKLNITNTASGASAYLMDLQVGAATQFRVTKAGAIRTAAPTSGTANDWKLGSVVGGTTVLDTTQWLEVEVGGTLYRVALVTLPEPEPGATPVSTPEDRKISEPVKTSSQRIQELENEIQELRKMVNFLMPTSKNKK